MRNLGEVLAALVLLVGCGDNVEIAGPEPEPEPELEPVELQFGDITDASPDLFAAPFKGNPGWGSSDKYSPGLALADLDGDGKLDLVQPRNDSRSAAHSTPHLYRGVGDGSFVDVTPAGWDVRRRSPAVLVFDIDGDDDLDVFFGVDNATSVLYRNDGGFVFTDVTAEAGLAAYTDRVFTAVAGDVDGDGDLDLYTGAWNASARRHGPGTAPNRLFLNDGTGVFVELPGAAECEGRSTLGASLVDLDRDGDLDLYVVNDFFDDCLYRNNGDMTFTDIAPEAGTDKSTRGGMGIAIGDLDGDGLEDILVTDSTARDDSIGNAVFMNSGDLNFVSSAGDLGLALFQTAAGNYKMLGWGCGIFDFDLDGDNDVHVVTHVTIREVFWQNSVAGFTVASGVSYGLPDADGRGSAYGDVDGDGDLDIVVGRRGDGRYIFDPAPVQVLRNDTPTPHGSIAVAIRPLSRAPGARVTVTTDDGRSQVRTLPAGSSYASSSPTEAIFGLGRSSVTKIEVEAIGQPAVVLGGPIGDRVMVDVVGGVASEI